MVYQSQAATRHPSLIKKERPHARPSSRRTCRSAEGEVCTYHTYIPARRARTAATGMQASAAGGEVRMVRTNLPRAQAEHESVGVGAARGRQAAGGRRAQEKIAQKTKAGDQEERQGDARHTTQTRGHTYDQDAGRRKIQRRRQGRRSRAGHDTIISGTKADDSDRGQDMTRAIQFKKRK